MAAGDVNLSEVGKLVAVIGDEDTVTGFLLAGVGHMDSKRNSNFFIVDKNTPKSQIEETFKKFIRRIDISIILINQNIAEDIRYAINDHSEIFPAVLEIPSKDCPYDSSKDSIFQKVQHMFTKD